MQVKRVISHKSSNVSRNLLEAKISWIHFVGSAIDKYLLSVCCFPVCAACRCRLSVYAGHQGVIFTLGCADSCNNITRRRSVWNLVNLF